MLTALRERSLTSENDPLEMRASTRVGADFPVRIHSRDFPIPLVARTRDLSVDGACLATSSPFAVKSLQRIELQLPGQNLLIEADGCWQRDEPVADLAHTESAVADSDCCLLEIDRTAYRYLCSARPWLAQRLATALVRVSALRLRNLYARCHTGS